jgi:predicted GNAT superfamily acetyltransferase
MRSVKRPKPRRLKLRPRVELKDGVLVRSCHQIEEFEACVGIEKAVWASADIDVVPLPLFVVAAETGGQVLGAFLAGEMIGFTLAIAGWREHKPFLHSHMTAVLERHRNLGIGRRLKLFQRDDALSRGIGLVEWTFDPLVAKNAYFNLMRLGAIARRYLANAYGVTTSPLHGSLPTDRLVAEWHLGSRRVKRILAGKRSTPAFSRLAVRIFVPADLETLRHKNPAEAVRWQSEIRAQFLHWLGKRYAVTAVAPSPSGMDYVLEPWKES